jgi:hypothetical protein
MSTAGGAFGIYQAAEAEMAAALGVDRANLSASEKIELATATALRIEHDRLERALRGGEVVDPTALVRVGQALAEMIEAAGPAPEGPDLTGFTDDQLTILERARAIVDTGIDPGHEQRIAELQARLDAAHADHRLTLEELQRERRCRADAERLAAERWQTITAMTSKTGEDTTLIEAQQRLIELLERKLSLYTKLMPTPPVDATEAKP